MTMSGTLSLQLEVAVNGTPLGEEWSSHLVSVEVDTSLALPASCVVNLVDPELSAHADLGIALGSPLSVSVGFGSDTTPAPIFSGEITAMEIEQEHNGTLSFVIRALDPVNRLYRGAKTKAFQQMTASDVVTEVLSDASGLSAGQIDPTDGTYAVITQANQSDWEFIQQLAAESNRVAYSSLGQLNFVEPIESEAAPEPGSTDTAPISCQLVMGSNIVRLRAGLSAAHQVASVEARGWDPDTKQALLGTGTAGTVSASNDDSPDEIAGTFGEQTYVATRIPYTDQSSADTLAAALAERIGSQFTEIEGTCVGDPGLLAGQAFSIAGAGDPFDGKYVATTATHRVDETGYWTSFTVGGTRDLSLGGLTAGAGGEAQRQRVLVPGIVTGTVSSVQDPDNKGRVQLTFPWLDDTYVSDWCRVVQVGAGSSWGCIVMPEVNSEVLVAFDHGDIRFPFVIGGLYNGQDTIAPQTDVELIDSGTGAVNQRLWQSRTKHLLYFNDDASSGAVLLQSGDTNHSLKFDQSGNGTVTLKSNGDITVQGNNITITAQQGLSLEGQQQLSLKSPQIQIQADSQLEVSSNGTGSLQATGTLSISGATTSINS